MFTGWVPEKAAEPASSSTTAASKKGGKDATAAAAAAASGQAELLPTLSLDLDAPASGSFAASQGVTYDDNDMFGDNDGGDDDAYMGGVAGQQEVQSGQAKQKSGKMWEFSERRSVAFFFFVY